jgi:hypothetical protein
MASQVAEPEALRLHATELLILLGTAIVLLAERPGQPAVDSELRPDGLALQQSQLSQNR